MPVPHILQPLILSLSSAFESVPSISRGILPRVKPFDVPPEISQHSGRV